MLLILAILATSMVAPVHDGDVDCGYPAYILGRVTWEDEGWVIITVTGQNNFDASDEVFVSGDGYNISLDGAVQAEANSPFSVSFTFMSTISSYSEDKATGIYFPDDFTFVYPQKIWQHRKNINIL